MIELADAKSQNELLMTVRRQGSIVGRLLRTTQLLLWCTVVGAGLRCGTAGRHKSALCSPNRISAIMKTIFSTIILCTLLCSTSFSDETKDAGQKKWQSLFNGKDLTGWKKVGREDSHWNVVDGEIRGTGEPSMLVCTPGPFKNFHYRAEVKINDGGNSGLYFRTTPEPGFLDGYEAQIDSTHTDPIRTGSLYGFCHVYKQLVKPGEWCVYEVEVRDDAWRGREMTRIKITVDGNELYEYLDFDKTYGPGHFAFQQHDPGSEVSIRKVEVMNLD